MKMKWNQWIATILMTAMAMNSVWADDVPSTPTPKEAPKPLNILLIGNSQCPTIIGNQMLEKLAASDKNGRSMKITGCIKSGASLQSHWEAGADPQTARGMISSGGWDYVILQDLYNVDEASFQTYARQFHELIKAAGGRTVLFGTASIISKYPRGFERQHRMYLAMGRELDVPIVDASQAYSGTWATIHLRRNCRACLPKTALILECGVLTCTPVGYTAW